MPTQEINTGHVDHPSLAAALAAFQAECPPVRKGSKANVVGKSKNGGTVTYSYAYADLSAIHEIIDPIKGKHGLSFSARPTRERDGSFVLSYVLRHESGENDRGVYPLPGADQMGPQDVGKMITYARRYAECAILGVAPGGDDDDAHDAQRHFEDRQAAPRPTSKRRSPAEANRPAEEAPHDWVAEAKAAKTRDAVRAIWQAAKHEAPREVLDEVAEIARSLPPAVTEERPAPKDAAPTTSDAPADGAHS